MQNPPPLSPPHPFSFGNNKRNILKLCLTIVQPIAITKPKKKKKKIGAIVSNLMMSLLLVRMDIFLNIFMNAFYSGLGKNSLEKIWEKSF